MKGAGAAGGVIEIINQTTLHREGIHRGGCGSYHTGAQHHHNRGPCQPWNMTRCRLELWQLACHSAQCSSAPSSVGGGGVVHGKGLVEDRAAEPGAASVGPGTGTGTRQRHRHRHQAEAPGRGTRQRHRAEAPAPAPGRGTGTRQRLRHQAEAPAPGRGTGTRQRLRHQAEAPAPGRGTGQRHRHRHQAEAPAPGRGSGTGTRQRLRHRHQAHGSNRSCSAISCPVSSLSKLIHSAASIIIFLNPPDTLLELMDHFVWK